MYCEASQVFIPRSDGLNEKRLNSDACPFSSFTLETMWLALCISSNVSKSKPKSSKYRSSRVPFFIVPPTRSASALPFSMLLLVCALSRSSDRYLNLPDIPLYVSSLNDSFFSPSYVTRVNDPSGILSEDRSPLYVAPRLPSKFSLAFGTTSCIVLTHCAYTFSLGAMISGRFAQPLAIYSLFASTPEIVLPNPTSCARIPTPLFTKRPTPSFCTGRISNSTLPLVIFSRYLYVSANIGTLE